MSNFKKFFATVEDDASEEFAPLTEQKEPPRLPPSKSGTIIAKGQTLEGALRGEGTIQVEGTVSGEISLRGAVIVAFGGTITGPVEAEVVRVAGHMEGNVTAREHLRLERTGRIDGDVSTVSLVVDDGAHFNGRCTTLEPPPSAKPGAGQPLSDFDELQFGDHYTSEESTSAKAGVMT